MPGRNKLKSCTDYVSDVSSRSPKGLQWPSNTCTVINKNLPKVLTNLGDPFLCVAANVLGICVLCSWIFTVMVG
jgi:hypothetical protein